MSINISLPGQALRLTEILQQPSEIKEVLPTPIIRALGIARGVYWRTFHPLTFGAAVALTDPEIQQIALVRTKYCDTKMWQLPGGGLNRNDKKAALNLIDSGVMSLKPEIFEPSARTEIKQEIGFNTENLDLSHMFNFKSKKDSKGRYANRDTLGVFHVALPDIDQLQFTLQPSEIAEVQLFDLDNLPKHRASYLGRLAFTLQEQRSQA